MPNVLGIMGVLVLNLILGLRGALEITSYILERETEALKDYLVQAYIDISKTGIKSKVVCVCVCVFMWR